jgi:hypothetical protein
VQGFLPAPAATRDPVEAASGTLAYREPGSDLFLHIAVPGADVPVVIRHDPAEIAQFPIGER